MAHCMPTLRSTAPVLFTQLRFTTWRLAILSDEYSELVASLLDLFDSVLIWAAWVLVS